MQRRPVSTVSCAIVMVWWDERLSAYGDAHPSMHASASGAKVCNGSYAQPAAQALQASVDLDDEYLR